MNKDEEIAAVVAELDGLLDQLRDNVAALNVILTPPAETGTTNGEEVPVG